MKKLSMLKSPLTYERENKNFRAAIPDGVVEGFLVYPKSTTTSYAISILGGKASVKGVVVEDDTDSAEILNLGGNNKHCLVFIDTRPSTPIYSFKEGTYGSPATLTPAEQEFGIKIADVWIPNTATSIQDALIVNISTSRPPVKRQVFFNPERFKITSGAPNQYKLDLLFGKLIVMSQRRTYDEEVVNFPISISDIQGATPSTDPNYVGGYEISVSLTSDEYIMFYVKIPKAESVIPPTLTLRHVSFASDTIYDNAEADLEAFFSASTTDPVSEQSRFNLDDVFIIAIVDTLRDNIFTPLGSIKINDEYNSGFFDSYIRTISSTHYGTGPLNATAGNLNIDNIITNLSELTGFGLNDVYNGIGTNSPNGEILVNNGAITYNISPNEQIPAGQRVKHSGFNSSEIGVDVVGEARGFVFRKQLFSGPITYTDFGALGVEVASIGGLTPNGEPEQKYILTVSGTGGSADSSYYQLRTVNNSFVLVNPRTGAINTVSSDFNGSFELISTTLFEVVAEISETSRLDDIIINNDVYGPTGGRFETQNVSVGTSFERVEEVYRNVSNYHTGYTRGASYGNAFSTEINSFAAIDVHTNQSLISAVNAAGNVRIYDPVSEATLFSYNLAGTISNPLVCQFEDKKLFVANNSNLYIWDDYTQSPTPITVNYGVPINDIQCVKGFCYVAHPFTAAFGTGTILSRCNLAGSVSDLLVGDPGDAGEEIYFEDNQIALRTSDGFGYLVAENEQFLIGGGSSSDAICMSNRFIFRATNDSTGVFTVDKISKNNGAVLSSATLNIGHTICSMHTISTNEILLVLPGPFGLQLVQIDADSLSITRNFLEPSITDVARGSQIDGEKCIIGCGYTNVLSFKYNFNPQHWMVDDINVFNSRKVRCLS